MQFYDCHYYMLISPFFIITVYYIIYKQSTFNLQFTFVIPCCSITPRKEQCLVPRFRQGVYV